MLHYFVCKDTKKLRIKREELGIKDKELRIIS